MCELLKKHGEVLSVKLNAEKQPSLSRGPGILVPLKKESIIGMGPWKKYSHICHNTQEKDLKTNLLYLKVTF